MRQRRRSEPPRRRAPRRFAGLVRAGFGLLVAGGSALLLPGQLAVAQPSQAQSGYWSQIPAGPQVPSGGTEVASDATGPTAVSAYRFTLPDGESAKVLTMKVAGAEPASQVALLACPVSAASSGWQPPSGAGNYADAPAADCSRGSVAGKLATDDSTVTFDLSKLKFADSTVDVRVQPNSAASPVPAALGPGSGSSYPTFEVDFQPVTAASLSTSGTATAAPAASSGAPAGLGQSAPAPSSAGSPVPSSAAVPSSSSLSAALPSTAGGSGPASFAAGSGGPSLASPSNNSALPSLQHSPRSLSTGPSDTGAAGTKSPWRWRSEYALGFVLIDLIAVMWYQQRNDRTADDRKPLSIYDPPPVKVAE